MKKLKDKEKKVDLKRNLKLFFKFASKYKLFFIPLIASAAIIESTGVFEKFLFKKIVDSSTNYASGNILLDSLIHILITVALIFFGTLGIKVFLNWSQIKIVNRLDGKMIYDIKTKFFNHIVHLAHSFHTTHKTGSLISKMTRGSRAIESITDFIVFNITPLILQVAITGVSLLYFDLSSAIVVVLTSLAFISFGIYMSKKQEIPQFEANDAEDFEKGTIADVLTNIDSVKYYGKEDLVKSRYSNLAKDTKFKQIIFWDLHTWFSAGQSLILGVGTFFLIYFPLMKLLRGELTVGDLAFIYTVYISLIGPLFGFIFGVRKFYVSLGDLDALFAYEKIQNDIKDKPNAEHLNIKKGGVEFKNVSFKYHKRNIINNLSLKINPGEKIALVGYSGAGKTTLIKLLYRFYDLNSGGISIDGKNISDFQQESLRSGLSIVPQECILFDDTIYNNILFSKPDAKKFEVLQALKFAQLDRFISSLPNKENTIVGERGVKLSGGEKQRVSIARALLADKKILVLDEATSSLDSKTEFEIQKALEKLMEGKTVIIIAHRISTIINSDIIVVMDKGRIAQAGKHETLVGQDGLYNNY